MITFKRKAVKSTTIETPDQRARAITFAAAQRSANMIKPHYATRLAWACSVAYQALEAARIYPLPPLAVVQAVCLAALPRTVNLPGVE